MRPAEASDLLCAARGAGLALRGQGFAEAGAGPRGVAAEKRIGRCPLVGLVESGDQQDLGVWHPGGSSNQLGVL